AASIQRRVTTCGGRRKTQPTVRDGLTTTKSHQRLLQTLDTFTWPPLERAHCIATVRRLWRQKLRRQEAKGRKQYNFILSDKAIKRLDRFSKNLEPSRARILEILLQMEDEKDLYLKEQIRVLRGIEL
ncbi:hypothetical protein ACRCPM_31365, partial [Pseudomonas aeruginosa]